MHGPPNVECQIKEILYYKILQYYVQYICSVCQFELLNFVFIFPHILINSFNYKYLCRLAVIAVTKFSL